MIRGPHSVIISSRNVIMGQWNVIMRLQCDNGAV